MISEDFILLESRNRLHIEALTSKYLAGTLWYALLKGATSRIMYFENVGPTISSLTFVIRLKFPLSNHPCLVLVCYYFFSVFLP